MPPELSGIDWGPLLKSPLFLSIPTTAGVALCVWIVTEVASAMLPKKYLPGVALALGPLFGWVTDAGYMLDYGSGPGSWLRAFFLGLLGGALAVLLHPHIKDRFPFSLLTRLTPSGEPPAPPAGG